MALKRAFSSGLQADKRSQAVIGSRVNPEDPTISTSGPGSGGGAVTSFSSGNLSPLFTTSVTNPTTTPALAFSITAATANYVFAGPSSGSSGTPSYRALVLADIPQLGVSLFNNGTNASSSTFLRGDGTWQSTSGGTVTNFSSGNLSPLFTTSTTNPTTTPALAFSITAATANYVFAGPSSGSSGTPSYRALVLADIPQLGVSLFNNGTNASSSTFLRGDGTWQSVGGGTGTVTNFSSGDLSPLFTTSITNPTTTPAQAFAQISQSANLMFAGPASGSASAPTFRAMVAADVPVTVDGYNVIAYGADPTGSADSASAFNSAISALNSAGSGLLLLPAGTYTLNSAPTTITAQVSIIGFGPGVTILNFASGVSGFTIDHSGSSTHKPSTVYGFTSNGSSGSSYSGVRYIPGTSGSDLHKELTVDNLAFGDGGDSWDWCINLDGGGLNQGGPMYISNIMCFGGSGSKHGTVIRVNNCSEVHMNGINAAWVNRLLYVTGDSEGIYISDWGAAACTNAMAFDGGTYGSAFHIGPGNCVTSEHGIILGNGTGNLTKVTMNGCDIAGPSSSSYDGVRIQGPDAVAYSFTGLTLSNFENGVHFLNGSRCKVVASDFDGLTNGVLLDSGTSGCIVTDNTSNSISGTAFLDNGSNHLSNNY